MNKMTALKIINPVLFVLVFAQIINGLLLENGIIESGWGLHRTLPWVIGAFVIVHLSLNWPWVKISYLRKK
jgi:hypothetical protein